MKGTNDTATDLTQGYDWSTMNANKSLLVDMGGANGHASVAIARANSNIQCIVQEIPDVLARAKYEAPDDVAGRVRFEAHNFFQPQPTVAQAYFFRQIFHNWGDEQSIQILRALIPALRHGAKVIINDFIVPPPGILPPMIEKRVRHMDLIMMSLFSAREREKEDWEMLFRKADSRFQDIRLWKPQNSQLGFIEATWRG